MLRFDVKKNRLTLEYEPEIFESQWLWEKLRTEGKASVGKVFHFKRDDLMSKPSEEQLEGNIDTESLIYRFPLARRSKGYWRIKGRKLGIENDVLFSTAITLERKYFAAHLDISIFGRIARIVDTADDIVIGGDHPSAIPFDEFERLLKKFPTTTEVRRYADARVADVLGNYLEGMQDARRNYEDYLSKRKAIVEDAPLEKTELLQSELQKYRFIRKTVKNWLDDSETRCERDWQQLLVSFLLLLFPKYVAVLQNITIRDDYSKPDKITPRYLDIGLVDSSGHLDIIEIKTPHKVSLFARGDYRDNRVPSRELSGAIMQAEKYLFHLSKWGVKGERKLTDTYRSELPERRDIRITNPKAIIMLGRDQQADGTDLTAAEQRLDYEVIRRKYANMLDIMTYDDLLRRLDNMIGALRLQIGQEDDC
ncbi:Shedu immune nuclease family protein [Novosphingobium naphthalenivorans]|uniref:Shedu immune nuclease family protein n=1 Tax=Novosphingobium naphthalenivorans TaxID=273168 RepID=UPI00083156D2|nr:Shedu immune nuclease family protein [Novosphingobium naphthalenivorans]